MTKLVLAKYMRPNALMNLSQNFIVSSTFIAAPVL